MTCSACFRRFSLEKEKQEGLDRYEVQNGFKLQSRVSRPIGFCHDVCILDLFYKQPSSMIYALMHFLKLSE
jgi:hypothetical protein